MESIVNGISSSSETQSSASVTGSSSSSSNSSSTSETPRPSRPPSPKPSRSEEPCTTSESIIRSNGVKVIRYPNGSISYQKQSFKPANEITLYEEVPTMADRYDESKIGKTEKGLPFNSSLELLTTEARLCIRNPLDGSENSHLKASLGPETRTPGPGNGSSGQLNSHKMDQSELSLVPISSSSQSAGTQYSESKAIVPTTEAIERTSSTEKSGISSEVTDSFGFTESRKVNTYRGSTSSDVSDESSLNSFSSASYKPHKANDTRWEAIQAVRSRVRELELKHFRLLKRLGCGDIGSVYLSELCGTKSSFAIKVMDKAALASRKKLLRAQTEREILQCLDHPFLPTLYTHFETDKLTCLVMEFCPGGDLHALRQKQPVKFFPEHAARFYVAEVLLALEYLHMLGIIYRDLKPENVLVREDGHIMLSDFDLSLRCSVSPTLVRSSNPSLVSKNSYFAQPARMGPTCVMQPDCMKPACFGPRFFSSKPKKDKKKKKKSKDKVNNETTHQVSLPELLAEPTNARSMSFVGTHEYLAPEIIKGEGHGSAVDWWTFGIFLYELLFGKTPFKGAGNRATLFNVVGEPLKFPDYPTVSFAARDLIRGLLVKEPQHRLAYKRGATEIKQHPFFQSVNWALIRCTSPPEVPRPDIHAGIDVKASGNYLEVDFF